MSATATLANGPESCFVVEAVDALLRRDVVGAEAALTAGAEINGWEAIAHRIDVVGRALAVDAGLRPDPDGDPTADSSGPIVLLPDLDTSAWAIDDPAQATDLVARWSRSGAGAEEVSFDQVWSSLAVVAWLVERAGYPAEVVV